MITKSKNVKFRPNNRRVNTGKFYFYWFNSKEDAKYHISTLLNGSIDWKRPGFYYVKHHPGYSRHPSLMECDILHHKNKAIKEIKANIKSLKLELEQI